MGASEKLSGGAREIMSTVAIDGRMFCQQPVNWFARMAQAAAEDGAAARRLGSGRSSRVHRRRPVRPDGPCRQAADRRRLLRDLGRTHPGREDAGSASGAPASG